MDQITKGTSFDKKPLKMVKKKQAKMSSSTAYKITFFAIVGTLFWQSASTTINHYQTNTELENIKRNQTIKLAEIEAARTQLQGVVRKLVQLSNAGNPNAAEVITRFKSAGVDIRLDNQG